MTWLWAEGAPETGSRRRAACLLGLVGCAWRLGRHAAGEDHAGNGFYFND